MLTAFLVGAGYSAAGGPAKKRLHLSCGQQNLQERPSQDSWFLTVCSRHSTRLHKLPAAAWCAASTSSAQCLYVRNLNSVLVQGLNFCTAVLLCQVMNHLLYVIDLHLFDHGLLLTSCCSQAVAMHLLYPTCMLCADLLYVRICTK